MTLKLINKIYLLLSFSLLMSCSNNFKYDLSENIVAPQDFIHRNDLGNFEFNDTFMAVNEDNAVQEYDLTSVSSKPTIVFFSSEFCHSCKEEAVHLKKFLAKRNLLPQPSNVNIVTILVDGTPEAAVNFRDEQKVPWQIGFDTKDMFFYYCTEAFTPCVLVLDPKRGVVLNTSEVIDVESLEKYTGKWTL